jgi:hypothetical protein
MVQFIPRFGVAWGCSLAQSFRIKDKPDWIAIAPWPSSAIENPERPRKNTVIKPYAHFVGGR